eukprot:8117-Heterococcus_DN1.PRE.5
MQQYCEECQCAGHSALTSSVWKHKRQHACQQDSPDALADLPVVHFGFVGLPQELSVRDLSALLHIAHCCIVCFAHQLALFVQERTVQQWYAKRVHKDHDSCVCSVHVVLSSVALHAVVSSQIAGTTIERAVAGKGCQHCSAHT